MLLNNSDLAGYQTGYEGPTKVPKARLPALTLNGWVRHLALLLNYLSDPRIGVLEREEVVYKPKNESLAPLFENAAGLNTPAKQYVFLMGVLYGHLIYVQGDLAGFNVGAGRCGSCAAAHLRRRTGQAVQVHLDEAARVRTGVRRAIRNS